MTHGCASRESALCPKSGSLSFSGPPRDGQGTGRVAHDTEAAGGHGEGGEKGIDEADQDRRRASGGRIRTLTYVPFQLDIALFHL